MRFLHTADWQIGMKAAHVGTAAEEVRKARLEAVGKLREVAAEREADFLVVAGDLFENNAVGRPLVRQVAEQLNGFPCPVYIIPGNHDPLVPGSVWEHPAWAEADKVEVLTEPRPVEVPGGRLYPCPVLDAYSEKDPTGWVPARKKDVIRIGVAHGTVEHWDTGTRPSSTRNRRWRIAGRPSPRGSESVTAETH